MGENVTRFKKENKLGVLVAIRAGESFDRYTVLKQGDYRTGRYGSQYDCSVISPFMDITTQDLWRTVTLLDLDSNEIYSMMYDAGVPIEKQRIGSPVNSHAGDAVKLYKVLNPGTYGKMVGRLNNCEFTASYGGVFNNGFKYIKLDQPKPFFDGIINSDSLAEALNLLELDYNVRSISESTTSKESKEVFNTKDKPVKSGDNIRLRKILPDFARQLAGDKAKEAGDEERAEYFYKNIPQQKTWYDYLVQLVNDAEPMYQKSWMPKFKTSIKHWAKTGSCVNETTIAAMRTISARKDKTFGLDDYDYEEFVDWAVAGYTDISRMPIIKFFRYNQECGENLAREYINAILERWDDGGREEFKNNEVLVNLMLNGGVLPHFGAAVEYKTQPSAKEIHMCVLKNQPYGTGDDCGSSEMRTKEEMSLANVDGSVDTTSCWKTGSGVFVDEDVLKDALKAFGDRTFHDKTRESANFKRCTVAALRSDIKLTYMGFGQSSEEKLIRANALAMFADNEEERQKKIKEFEQLKKKVEKEKADEAAGTV